MIDRTFDLRLRVIDHKELRVKATAGRDPRLALFQCVPDGEAAARLTSNLKATHSRNRTAINCLVIDFGGEVTPMPRCATG